MSPEKISANCTATASGMRASSVAAKRDEVNGAAGQARRGGHGQRFRRCWTCKPAAAWLFDASSRWNVPSSSGLQRAVSSEQGVAPSALASTVTLRPRRGRAGLLLGHCGRCAEKSALRQVVLNAHAACSSASVRCRWSGWCRSGTGAGPGVRKRGTRLVPDWPGVCTGFDHGVHGEVGSIRGQVGHGKGGTCASQKQCRDGQCSDDAFRVVLF